MLKRKKNLLKTLISEWENLSLYVRRRISNISEMDVEDIVADVVFNIYNRVNMDQHIENVLSYAYRAVKNRISDHFRLSKRNTAYEDIDEVKRIPGLDIPAVNENGETRMESAELRKDIQAALMSLNKKQRDLWIATEIEGTSFKRLSEKWNEPIGTLLARKSRASKKLKEKLLKINKEIYP